MPYAFTEQGVAILSGILHSDVAIHVNIAIMRTFVWIRNRALEHTELSVRLHELENRYDKKFEDVYQALHFLMAADSDKNNPKERKQIGYKKN